MASLIMAHDLSQTHNVISNTNASTSHHLNPMFHDFLGMKSTDSPLVLAPKIGAADVRLLEPSPSASASVGASSSAAHGPVSTTSDLGSERQVGGHLEGVPFYGLRSNISGPEMSNRLAGSKRSNLDLPFMGSSRENNPQIASDSRDNSHLMKILRNVAGGERPRKSNNEEAYIGMQPLRPSSASLTLQPPTSNRIDTKFSKWERSIPMNLYSAVPYPPRGGQFSTFTNQVPQSRFKDSNAGPSIISQSAADEGSRTGINGPAILSSINASSGVCDRNSSGSLPSGSRGKPGALISEPESSTTPSQHGFTTASRQMTIFYGGQAHVFDNVHPKKADVIMSLAGSNGGSWSTSYSPKAAVRPVGETYLGSGEHENGITSNMGIPREARLRLSVTGNSSHGVGSVDQISTPTGSNPGSIVAKETKNPTQAAEPSTDDTREI